MSKKDPARSARLIYRPPASPEDDLFFQAINNDRVGYMNSNISNATLSNNNKAKKYQEHVMNSTLLGAVICLPPSSSTANASGESSDSKDESKPTPIGCIHLGSLRDDMAHHRYTDIGIDILPEWQGKGYGSEAIAWALDWAFDRLNMHKVQIRAFGWNEGALKLYQRIGFTQEGRWREHLWHEGRYWDDIQFGMLAREWQDIKKAKAEK
ncbi:Hypothetical protein D9617_6g094580 [Elsinoe fawcettii]|nr:Hypothetical protein D9617_6g094580 [Elsinoe fawcettii]